MAAIHGPHSHLPLSKSAAVTDAPLQRRKSPTSAASSGFQRPQRLSFSKSPGKLTIDELKVRGFALECSTRGVMAHPPRQLLCR